MINYFARLGVSIDATDDQIRQQYRAAAKRLHPDVRPDDPEATRELSELSTAYNVLKDRKRRDQHAKLLRSMWTPCGLCHGDGCLMEMGRGFAMLEITCQQCGGQGGQYHDKESYAIRQHR